MSDINEETSTEYSGDYPEIAAAYKAGEELSDEQLDTIADVAISILRSILGYFDASDSPIDEYEGDEGELILDVTAPRSCGSYRSSWSYPGVPPDHVLASGESSSWVPLSGFC